MRRPLPPRDAEKGVMLIEALIAILIFSIGILAVVGMQGVAIKNVTESRSRSEAAFLAQALLAQMWIDQNISPAGANTSNVNVANYNYAGSGAPPARLKDWVAQINAKLPGSTTWMPKVTITNPAPTVGSNPNPADSGADVKIEIFWQSPEEGSLSLPPHNYTITASIRV
jgi:type IV pilus assembly protein PilV